MIHRDDFMKPSGGPACNYLIAGMRLDKIRTGERRRWREPAAEICTGR